MNWSKKFRRACLTLANWTHYYAQAKRARPLARSLVFLWHICFAFEDGDRCPDLRGLGPLCRGLQRPRQGRMSPQQASHSSVTAHQKALHHPHQKTKIRKGNYWLGCQKGLILCCTTYDFEIVAKILKSRVWKQSKILQTLAKVWLNQILYSSHIFEIYSCKYSKRDIWCLH